MNREERERERENPIRGKDIKRVGASTKKAIRFVRSHSEDVASSFRVTKLA